MTSSTFFESITAHFNKDLPFVAYKKPNEVSVKALLQQSDELYEVNDFTETGFVFAPFNLETNKTVLLPLEFSEEISAVISKDSKTKSIIQSSHNERSRSVSEESHVNLVNKGITAIKEKQFQKVVLSRYETVSIEIENTIPVFQKLLQQYPTAFVYCWFHPKVGLWLGATPETLLKVEGNRLQTMSLAGTQQFNGTLDVTWQDKEKEEQQFVTDFIVDSLKPLVNAVNVSDVKTVKAGNLLHQKTAITANFQSSSFNLKHVVKSLHPTPAVCGLPKEAAKQFILKNENYNREYYTGFLGELNVKQSRTRNTNRRNVENNAYQTVKTVSNLFVNLRCMQFKNNEALIYVGGGITKDSVAESEFQETVNKAQTMLNVLN